MRTLIRQKRQSEKISMKIYRMDNGNGNDNGNDNCNDNGNGNDNGNECGCRSGNETERVNYKEECKRLTNSIIVNLSEMDFYYENISAKLLKLKSIEEEYNEVIDDRILSLTKSLYSLHSDYLRDTSESEDSEDFNIHRKMLSLDYLID